MVFRSRKCLLDIESFRVVIDHGLRVPHQLAFLFFTIDNLRFSNNEARKRWSQLYVLVVVFYPILRKLSSIEIPLHGSTILIRL